MKRSKSIRLVTMGLLPIAITACESSTYTQNTKVSQTFESFSDCKKQGVPEMVCSDNFQSAYRSHQQLAPRYDTKEACEADFEANYCLQDGEKWMPKMAGFRITREGPQTFSRETGQMVNQPQHSSSGSSNDGLLTGMLIGHMMSGGNNVHYYSEPAYIHRDSRGEYSRSTLRQRINDGQTFSNATRAPSARQLSTAANRNTANASTSGYKSSGTKSVSSSSSRYGSSANSSSVSRSGFGSQASARSGFGSFGG